MGSRKMTVTPKLAREWLTKNRHNRPAIPNAISRYVADILDNRWKVNGESIKFNCDGTLVDGQNRLLAVIQADTPITSYVVFGVEKDAFDTIDSGEQRTLGHVFARNKEKHYNTLASAVRWLWSLSDMKGRRRQKLRHSVGKDLLKENAAIRESVAFILGAHMSKLTSSSLMAALHYLCSQKHAGMATEYFAAIATGENLSSKHPAYKLRSDIVSAMRASSPMPLETLAAKTVLGWNALREKRFPRNLNWDGEKFPEIK
jgi:hypothetical protein